MNVTHEALEQERKSMLEFLEYLQEEQRRALDEYYARKEKEQWSDSRFTSQVDSFESSLPSETPSTSQSNT